MADKKGSPLSTGLGAPTRSHGGAGSDDSGVRSCVACGRPHGPVGQWIACLSRAVVTQRALARELADVLELELLNGDEAFRERAAALIRRARVACGQ